MNLSASAVRTKRSPLLTILTVAVGVTVLNVIIGVLARQIFNAPTFAPLTLYPLIGGSFGGVLLAQGVYALLRRASPRPWKLIVGVTVVVWLASFILPLRLFRPNVPVRFAGVTPPLAATLLVLHTFVAGASLLAYRRWSDDA